MIVIDGLTVKTYTGDRVTLSLNIHDNGLALLVDELGVDTRDLYDKLRNPGDGVSFTNGRPILLTHEIYGADRVVLNELLEYIMVEYGARSWRGVDSPSRLITMILDTLSSTGVKADIVIHDPLIYTPRSIWGEVVSGINRLRINGSSIIIYTYTPEIYRGLVIDKIYRVTGRGVVRGSGVEEFRVNRVVYMIYTDRGDILGDLPGLTGYILLGPNTYLVFIDRGRYVEFRGRIIEYYYNGLIRGFKPVERGLLRFG